MLTNKTDTKKNVIYGIVLLVVFGFIGYMLANNFNLLPNRDGGGKTTAITIGNTASRKAIKEVQAKTENLDIIDISLFEDSRFKRLREKANVEIDVSNIRSGKNNPFEPEER